MLAGWLLFTMMFFAAYSSSLRAFLVSPMFDPPIETMEDIIGQTLPWDYLLALDLTYIDETENPVLREFWDKKETLLYTSAGPPITQRQRVSKLQSSMLLAANSIIFVTKSTQN